MARESAIQYSRDVNGLRRGRGVLGPPVKPGDDTRVRGGSGTQTAQQLLPAYFFFTSFTAENSIPSDRSLV
jgi:hypothetical protein